MSGRIRTIKPELLEDAVSAGLSDMAFRIFIAAILLADDYGRLRYEPAWLQGQVYWARQVDPATFVAAVGELASLITGYVVNGQRYAEIRNWAKHQKVSHPGKPRIPPPSETLRKPSGESHETLVPDLGSRILDLGSRPPTGGAQGGPEVPPDRPSETFAAGTAGAETALAVFGESVSEATGQAFALGRAPWHGRDICELLNKHGPPGPKPQRLSWLRGAVAGWVRSTDPGVVGGCTPTKLLDWLNAGKPDRRGRKPAAEITKQPFDENAPWIRDNTFGDTGS